MYVRLATRAETKKWMKKTGETELFYVKPIEFCKSGGGFDQINARR
jgi:hypothetical protein